jgi:UDPglucose 6-dehydrogenase
MMDGIHYAKNPYEALDGADAMVIITEWDQFRALDLDRVKNTLAGNVVVDLRNIYEASDMVKRGFTYSSIGRP